MQVFQLGNKITLAIKYILCDATCQSIQYKVLEINPWQISSVFNISLHSVFAFLRNTIVCLIIIYFKNPSSQAYESWECC